MKKERKFEGVWDVEKVLRNYLYFSNEHGTLIDMSSYEESPYKIRQQRLLAALNAYGRDSELFYHSDDSFDESKTCCLLLSKVRSKEKMDEFRNLVKQNLPANSYFNVLISSEDTFSNELDIQLAFEKLFEFRKGLFALEHQWSGVLECSKSLGMIYRATSSLYGKHMKPVCDVVDKMLTLLMGDDYDKSFTEKELFPFGYPDVTDDELYEMDLDW